MKNILPPILALIALFGFIGYAAASSDAVQIVPGILSTTTTGATGCVTNGLGNPPCFIQYGPTNPLPATTTSH